MDLKRELMAKYEFRLAFRCVESKCEILFQRKLVGLPLMCEFSHLRRPCGRRSMSIRASHSISFSCLHTCTSMTRRAREEEEEEEEGERWRRRWRQTEREKSASERPAEG